MCSFHGIIALTIHHTWPAMVVNSGGTPGSEVSAHKTAYDHTVDRRDRGYERGTGSD